MDIGDAMEILYIILEIWLGVLGTAASDGVVFC